MAGAPKIDREAATIVGSPATTDIHPDVAPMADASLTDDLDPLPFGNGSAKTFDGVAPLASFLERQSERPTLFDSVGSTARFRVRMRGVTLPTLSMLAGSSTPKLVDHESPRATLVIPFGRCGSTIRVDRAEHRWASPYHAFFIPAGERARAESTAGSFLRLDIDERALVATAAGMVDGRGPVERAIETRAPRTVPLQVGDFNWLAHVRAICATVDALRCDVGAIVGAGLDEAILRSVVMMLRPECFVPTNADRPAPRGFDLDPLLERAVAGLGERISLSDMERWSGRTTRAIQLAFQKRFGIGPMQWLRERRLDAINARLSAPGETASVRQIARECGIPRMATLVAEYARRFGEKPSETRSRRRV